MNINIKTSLDNLLTIVDEFKTDIKENDYVKVMNELKIINENNNHKLYELTFLIFSADYRSIARCSTENLDITETIMPTINMVKQRFLLTETDVDLLNNKIDKFVNGLNTSLVYGVLSSSANVISKKLGNFMNELEKGDRTRDYEYNLGVEEINIYKNIEKEVRLINVKEIVTRRRGQVVRRLAQMSDDDDDDESEERRAS
tara:strand:+ start:621 stop:1223 length:603 start_codon:yes stop_codon:yes gene_type:complete